MAARTAAATRTSTAARPATWPLFDETTARDVVCSAFCKPADCYADHAGAAAHANPVARRRTAATTPTPRVTSRATIRACMAGCSSRARRHGAESPYSDTTGLCLPHASTCCSTRSGLRRLDDALAGVLTRSADHGQRRLLRRLRRHPGGHLGMLRGRLRLRLDDDRWRGDDPRRPRAAPPGRPAIALPRLPYHRVLAR